MRRFSGRLAVGVLAIAGGYAAARSLGLKPPGASLRPRGAPASALEEPVSTAAGASGETDGNALMTRVLATLENWPNVAARFRQSLRFDAEPLSGTGEYWQRGVGNQRLTCWQWQTLAGDQLAAFSQIYDKNSHVWTDCRYADKRTVTRIDLKRLRRDLSVAVEATAVQGGAAGRADELERLARGGLSQTIAELRRCFEFGPPAPMVVDGQPLVAMVGRWRAEALGRQWPSLSAASPVGWPPHLPHHVVVKVGRDNFFPYVIEYRSGADADLAESVGAAADPLARYEFYDVRWAVTMPDRLFEFTPTDVDWHDVTSRVLARLQPAAPAAAAEVANREGTWRN